MAQNGGTGVTGGNWYPTSPTQGISAAALLIPTAGIAPTAVTQSYTVLTGFSGVTIGVTILTSRVAPTAPQTGYFDMQGLATIQIPANCTLIHEIREGSATGPVRGQQVIPNTIAGPVTYPFLVPGRASAPVWGGLYGTVANVVNNLGVNVAFTVLNSGFELIHVKV